MYVLQVEIYVPSWNFVIELITSLYFKLHVEEFNLSPRMVPLKQLKALIRLIMRNQTTE